MKRPCPYGEWPSPITPETVAAAGRKLGPVVWDGDVLAWAERRPEQGGRTTVVRRGHGGACEDLLAAPFDARSAVHEYGGGAFALRDGHCWFVNGADQRLYHRPPAGTPAPLTAAGRDWAFADLQVDAARGRVVAVCEDHSVDGEPSASIVAVAADGAVHCIAAGRDFFASPRLAPNGDHLVWLAWDHPNMPWDATELWQAPLDAAGRPGPARRLAGGAAQSLFAPVFAPDGELFVVSDADGWWNIQRVTDTGPVALTRESAEFGLPQWVFGQSTYGFDDDGGLYALFTQNGSWRLARVDRGDGGLELFDLPFTHLEQLRVAAGRLAFLGGSAASAMTLCSLRADGTGLVRVRAAAALELDAAALSAPQAIDYPSADGAIAHALFYPPKHPELRGPADTAPPLLIKCHGGPTGATDTALDPRIQFWTSRGFAVLDVNYRGSVGYGRAYREALYGAWGVADVADCVHGVAYLAGAGRIDRDRVAISGSSAGGYTVLCVLAFTDVAAAGASYYGIGDLERLLTTTHKFESRYLKRLIGDDACLLRARSPLYHADEVTCPVLFLQGQKDKVVPPEQAETMAAALRDRGLPVAHIAFAEERHGFRDAANIAAAIGAELAFYARVLGFTPTPPAPTITIDNLPAPPR